MLENPTTEQIEGVKDYLNKNGWVNPKVIIPLASISNVLLNDPYKLISLEGALWDMIDTECYLPS